MNFREFKELINSGANEITLTEDVIISNEDKGKSSEISFDADNLIIDGNNHEFVSHNKITLNFNGRGIVLKNLSFKMEYPWHNCIIYNNGGLNVKNCNFSGTEFEYSHPPEEKSSFFNRGHVDFSNSSVSNLINEGEADLYKCNLNDLHNSGEANLNYCTIQFHDSFINEKNLEINNSIFLDNGKRYYSKNEGYLKISGSVFKNFEIGSQKAIIHNKKGTVKLRDTTFEESHSRYPGLFTHHAKKGYIISNVLGHVDAYNCKFINESYEKDINGFYNVGASLIFDSCEFKGIAEELIYNINKTIDEEKLNEDGKNIEYSSNVILKNCKYEDYNNIITDNDNISILDDESMPVIKKIKGLEYLSNLIHSGQKEIRLDYHLEGAISIDEDDITIDGCGNTIQGTFNITACNVTFKNIKFKYSAGIENHGKSLKIVDCIFESNPGNPHGAAIMNEGTICIENSLFKENVAYLDGGSIANIGGKILLENCEFIGNRSGRYGGAIYNEDGSLSILNCNFSDNYVTYLGETCPHIADAIFNLDGTVNIENSSFKRCNSADFFNNGILNISQSNISGDIWNVGCLSVKKCQFEEGTSIENSALIYMLKSEEEYIKNFIKTFRGKIQVPNFILPKCDTHSWKGKIRYFDDLVDYENKNDFNYLNDLINSNLKDLDNDDNLEIHLDNDIINNDDDFEKGIEINEKKLVIDGNGHSIDANSKSSIFNISSSNIVLRRIVFKNSFSCNLAAINVLNTNITLENCIFESNDTVKWGGSLNIKDSSLKAVDCDFTDNFASQGGAIYADNSSIELSGCNFSMNNVNDAGGAFKLDDSDLISIKSNFNNNIAKNGAVGEFTSSNSCFYGCGFKNNSSIDDGGVIYSILSRAKFDGCIFEDNKSECSSIVYGEVKDNFIFKKSNFKNNRAKSSLIILLSLAPHSLDGKEFLSNKLYCIQCNFENNICSKYSLIGVGQLYMSGCDFRNNKYGDVLINVREFLLRDGDDFPESKIKAEQVIENVNTEIDFKNLIGSGKKDISLKSDYVFFEDGKFDADGLCIDGQMHEITGNMTITGKNVTLKNIIFKDTLKIENNDTATLDNCSFEGYKNEIIINKANLTLKNCSFKEKHKILNIGEVTLIDDVGTEVLTDEIIELYEEEKSFDGLGALFG